MCYVVSVGKVHEIALVGGPSSGKCVLGNTPVVINGGLVNISDLWENSTDIQSEEFDGSGYWRSTSNKLFVPAMSEDGKMISAEVTRLYRQKINSKGRKVVLRDGSELTMTQDHRLYERAKGWVDKISEGDRVAVPRIIPANKQPIVDPDLVVLLAWQISEGHEEKSSVTITQKDPEVLYKVRKCAQRISERIGINMNSMSINKYNNRNTSVLAIHSVQYRNKLISKGYKWGEKSAEKVIPDWIVGADETTLTLFLREYFAAEGSVASTKNNIEVSSASKELMQQLVFMLRRLGVLMKIREKRGRATNGKNIWRKYYVGEIPSLSIQQFAKKVGIASPRKNIQLNNLLNKINSSKHTLQSVNNGIIMDDILLDLYKVTKLSRHYFGLTSAYMRGQRKSVNLEKAQNILVKVDGILDGTAQKNHEEYVSSLKKGDHGRRYIQSTREAFKTMDYGYVKMLRNELAKRISEEVVFCKVVEIKTVKIEGWVYDLEIEKYHNYVAGGMISHNTTSLSYLSEKLSDYGYRVFIVPEVATMVITGGIPDMRDLIEKHQTGDVTYDSLQEQIFLIQRDLRKRFQDLASLFPEDDCVIIYDRAEMDVASYTEPEVFQDILERHKLNYHDVRDSYSGVVHLVTAAIGAEEFYTTDNNKARREGLVEAREADRRTLYAWTGHPKLRIVDNTTDFEGKLRRTLAVFASILGIPEPLEIERKFLLKKAPNLADLKKAKAHMAEIEQTYLLSPSDREIRVRQRTADGITMYYQTEKISVKTNEGAGLIRQEREKIITKHEYERLLMERDPDRHAIKKTRYCFPYESNYFEVDVITEPRKVAILEVELVTADDDVQIPSFIQVEREVTDDENARNAFLAKKT